MANYLRAYRDPEASADDGRMWFTASTTGKKRDGLSLDMGRWTLDNYKANPVVLIAHNYRMMPVGNALVEVTDGKLRAGIQWDEHDPDGARAKDKYERGYMHAISVGWQDVDDLGEQVAMIGGRARDSKPWHELLDISAVAVPGDAQALIETQRALLGALLEDVDSQPSEHAEPDWPAIATEMVRVMAAPGDDADAEGTYRSLLPHYRRHGKVAPEWLTAEERDAATDATWAGVFLEDELMVADVDLTNARAGAVLNARNKADLRQIMVLARRILESAGPIEDDDTEEKTDEDARGNADYWSYVRSIMEAD